MYALRPASPAEQIQALQQGLDLAVTQTHLRAADGSQDDYLATVLIPAAVAAAECQTGRQIITLDWRLTRDSWPCRGEPLLVPLPPLQEVTAVRYVDAQGDEQIWDPADYAVLNEKEPAEIWPAHGHTWPALRREAGAVTVEFRAGYGPTSASVPPLLSMPMLLLAGHLYRNPQAVATGTIATEIPLGMHWMFQKFAVGDDFSGYDRHEAWSSGIATRW